MDSIQRVLITLSVGAVLIISFFVITGAITKYTGFFVADEKNDFKDCIDERDVRLYINTNEVSKTLNEIIIKDYLDKIEIVNCLINNNLCLEEGVMVFPTWIIEESKIERDISLEDLSRYAGCDLIKLGGKYG